jgi:hypothetical protein
VPPPSPPPEPEPEGATTEEGRARGLAIIRETFDRVEAERAAAAKTKADAQRAQFEAQQAAMAEVRERWAAIEAKAAKGAEAQA